MCSHPHRPPKAASPAPAAARQPALRSPREPARPTLARKIEDRSRRMRTPPRNRTDGRTTDFTLFVTIARRTWR